MGESTKHTFVGFGNEDGCRQTLGFHGTTCRLCPPGKQLAVKYSFDDGARWQQQPQQQPPPPPPPLYMAPVAMSWPPPPPKSHYGCAPATVTVSFPSFPMPMTSVLPRPSSIPAGPYVAPTPRAPSTHVHHEATQPSVAATRTAPSAHVPSETVVIPINNVYIGHRPLSTCQHPKDEPEASMPQQPTSVDNAGRERSPTPSLDEDDSELAHYDEVRDNSADEEDEEQVAHERRQDEQVADESDDNKEPGMKEEQVADDGYGKQEPGMKAEQVVDDGYEQKEPGIKDEQVADNGHEKEEPPAKRPRQAHPIYTIEQHIAVTFYPYFDLQL